MTSCIPLKNNTQTSLYYDQDFKNAEKGDTIYYSGGCEMLTKDFQQQKK